MNFHIIDERLEIFDCYLILTDAQSTFILFKVCFVSQKSNGKRKEEPPTGTPTKTKGKYLFAGGNRAIKKRT